MNCEICYQYLDTETAKEFGMGDDLMHKEISASIMRSVLSKGFLSSSPGKKTVFNMNTMSSREITIDLKTSLAEKGNGTWIVCKKCFEEVDAFFKLNCSTSSANISETLTHEIKKKRPYQSFRKVSVKEQDGIRGKRKLKSYIFQLTSALAFTSLLLYFYWFDAINYKIDNFQHYLSSNYNIAINLLYLVLSLLFMGIVLVGALLFIVSLVSVIVNIFKQNSKSQKQKTSILKQPVQPISKLSPSTEMQQPTLGKEESLSEKKDKKMMTQKGNTAYLFGTNPKEEKANIPPKKKELVEYIGTNRTAVAGAPPIEFVIEEYKAPNKATAIEFLNTKTVIRPYHMITVETPEVKMVKDKDGIFERNPRG